jgi:predicted MFS family arabinose efflux permease
MKKVFCFFKSPLQILIFFRFFSSVSGGLIFYISLFLVSSHHFSVEKSGLYLSVYGLGTMLGGYFGGVMSDKNIRSGTAVCALLLNGICLFTLSRADSSLVLLICVFIVGLASYAFIVTNNLEVLDQSSTGTGHDNSRLMVLNRVQIISNVGIGSAAFLISMISVDQMYAIYSITGICLILLSGLYYLFHRCRLQSIEIPVVEVKIGERSLPKKRILIGVLMTVFSVGWIISQRRTTYAPYLHMLFPGLGFHGIGFLFALNPLLIIIFQAPVVGRLAKYRPYISLGIGLALLSIGTGLLSHIQYYVVAIAACVIYTFGEMLFFAPAQLLCYQNSKVTSRGKALGAFKSIYALSTLVGPFSGALIYGRFGADSLWGSTGLVGMAIAILFVLMTRWMSRSAVV